MSKIVRVLKGATSPETAFVQSDYPYGRSLRCKRRVWLEHKASKGFRIVSQTTDPRYFEKHGIERWNAPKPSTYSDLAVLVLTDEHKDDAGNPTHVTWIGLGFNSSQDALTAFLAKFGPSDLDENQIQAARDLEILIPKLGSKSTGRKFNVFVLDAFDPIATGATAGEAFFAGVGPVEGTGLKDNPPLGSIGPNYLYGFVHSPVLGRVLRVEWIPGT